MHKTVELKDIKTSNEYLRKDTDIESLKKSIESIGLINPLTVNPELELLAGSRRLEAMKELGWQEATVHVVERDSLEQELISIDENLVKKPLNKLEFEKCLNRGREIYEKLNPLANKVEVEARNLSPAEKKEEKEKDEQDTDSFAAVTSQKTGLSKAVIKSAIKRDALSSEKIKRARAEGELSASQVNEMIKLDHSKQEEVLPLIKDRSVKDVRKIVTLAKDSGVDAVKTYVADLKTVPREFQHLNIACKKASKLVSQIMLEDIAFEGRELDLMLGNIYKLKENLEDFISRYTETSTTLPEEELHHEATIH